MTVFVKPQIYLSDVDRINRKAAATGSVRYAMATGDADYNGHPVSVSYKPHAASGPTWNAEYYWGQRVVLGRGSFAVCLQAALNEYRAGHRGAMIAVYLSDVAPESLDEQTAACEQFGLVRVPDTGQNPWDFAASLAVEPAKEVANGTNH